MYEQILDKVMRECLAHKMECKTCKYHSLANIVRYPVNSISITYATSSALSENDKSSSTIFQVCYLNDSLVIT